MGASLFKGESPGLVPSCGSLADSSISKLSLSTSGTPDLRGADRLTTYQTLLTYALQSLQTAAEKKNPQKNVLFENMKTTSY